MWTGDGRVFFYNPSCKQSVWERPKELEGRADVDKAIITPPEHLVNIVKQKNNNKKDDLIDILQKSDSEHTSDNENLPKRLKLEGNIVNLATHLFQFIKKIFLKKVDFTLKFSILKTVLFDVYL